MAGLYPMPGDTHTGKNLEYIKDMISGISLQSQWRHSSNISAVIKAMKNQQCAIIIATARNLHWQAFP